MSEKYEMERLKEYFRKRDDVEMAFLFGSRAKGKNYIHEDSDWDIALYFKPKSGIFEWQTEIDYTEQREDVRENLSELLDADNIDLIVLNNAYPTVADSAIRGMPLAVKNRLLWLRLMLTATNESIDFRKTAREYYEIFERSHSLNEQDAYELERKIEFMETGK